MTKNRSSRENWRERLDHLTKEESAYDDGVPKYLNVFYNARTELQIFKR